MANWYRKRPTEIEAVRFTGDNVEDIGQWVGIFDGISLFLSAGHDMAGTAHDQPVLYVAANDGWLNVTVGTWIAKDSKGFYPIDPQVFATSYEPSDGTGIHA